MLCTSITSWLNQIQIWRTSEHNVLHLIGIRDLRAVIVRLLRTNCYRWQYRHTCGKCSRCRRNENSSWFLHWNSWFGHLSQGAHSHILTGYHFLAQTPSPGPEPVTSMQQWGAWITLRGKHPVDSQLLASMALPYLPVVDVWNAEHGLVFGYC